MARKCAFHFLAIPTGYTHRQVPPWHGGPCGGQVHETHVLRSGKWAVSTALCPDVAYPPYAIGAAALAAADSAAQPAASVALAANLS